MKIKTKLIIAFCIIIFVPILLATATVVGFCNFQAHAIEETYGIKNTDAYSVINSVQLLNRYTVADFQKIQKIDGGVKFSFIPKQMSKKVDICFFVCYRLFCRGDCG